MKHKALQRTAVSVLVLLCLSALLVLANNQFSTIAIADIYDASGKAIGSASFRQSSDQTQIIIKVSGISPGKHGTHIHTGAACTDTQDTAGNMVKFGGALSHFDPKDTKLHGAPHNHEGQSHAGDIENILVDASGNGSMDFSTKKLTVTAGPLSLAGRSIVIHANEDRFTNEPPLGGSGGRIACGVIKAL